MSTQVFPAIRPHPPSTLVRGSTFWTWFHRARSPRQQTRGNKVQKNYLILFIVIEVTTFFSVPIIWSTALPRGRLRKYSLLKQMFLLTCYGLCYSFLYFNTAFIFKITVCGSLCKIVFTHLRLRTYKVSHLFCEGDPVFKHTKHSACTLVHAVTVL